MLIEYLSKKLLEFVSKTEVIAEWGYQEHFLVGLGQWFMFGAALGIERYKDSEMSNSEFICKNDSEDKQQWL
jgi:hypothetical protein